MYLLSRARQGHSCVGLQRCSTALRDIPSIGLSKMRVWSPLMKSTAILRSVRWMDSSLQRSLMSLEEISLAMAVGGLGSSSGLGLSKGAV
jgi:hypothetical protein